MSFWKSLFGGLSGGAEKASEPVEYNGFTIRAAPYKDQGQYQTAGIITKEVGGVAKEHKFIRADRHADIARNLRQEEWDRAMVLAREAGLKNLYEHRHVSLDNVSTVSARR